MPDLITLFQFGITTTFATLAVIILLWFHRLTSQKQAKLSMQLQIHLKVWLVYLLGSLTYLLPSFYFLCFPSATEYNTLLVALRGSLHFSAVNTVGLSTTFTALDRILVLLAPTMANSRTQRWMNLSSILVIAAYSGGIFALAFYEFQFYAEGSTTACILFSCIVGSRMNNVVICKMVVSIANFLLGSFFVYLFFAFEQKTIIRKEKKKNYLVFWLLVAELFLTIVPTAGYLITDVIKSDSNQLIRYTMSIFYSLDGFTTACIYWRTWLERTRIRSIHTIVAPNVNHFTNTTLVCSRQLRTCTFCRQSSFNNKT